MSDSKSGVTLANTLAPLPETQRGYPCHIYANTGRLNKKTRMIYTNGRSVVIRDLDDVSKSFTFTEHKAKVNVAQFSPNGEWVASGDSEGKVLVWGVENLIVKTTIECGTTVNDLCWDSEGKRIIAAGDGEFKARCFSWDSGSNLGTIDFHSKNILSCSIKQTRPFRIVTSSEDLKVNFYEAFPAKFNKTIGQHDRYPNTVRFSPDGAFFISVGSDSRICVYDGAKGDFIREFDTKENGHKGAIFSFAWSPDSKQIITTSADKTAKLWDVADGTCVTTFNFASKPETADDQQVGALWHGPHVVTVSLSGALNFLDLDNPDKPKLVIQGHKDNMHGFDLDKKTGLFYSADVAGKVCQWDIKTQLAKWFTGKGHAGAVCGLALNSDGEILASIGYDDKIRFNSTKELAFSPDAVCLGGRPCAVAAGRQTSDLFAVVLEQKQIVIIRNGDVVSTTDIDFEPLNVAFNDDDTELAVSGKNKTLNFYALKDDTPVFKVAGDGPDRNVNAIRYSADGKFSVAVDANRRISVFDAEKKNRTPLGWAFHGSQVTDAAFSPSVDMLATVSMDESIIVWKNLSAFSSDFRTVVSLAHTGGVLRVDWSDDKTILTAGADRSLKMWSL